MDIQEITLWITANDVSKLRVNTADVRKLLVEIERLERACPICGAGFYVQEVRAREKAREAAEAAGGESCG
jgi:predicted nucleic acid-binding Zn ribbon protein